MNRLRTRGMTAIEVLAATVLASLMLASVAGLTGALARQQRVLRAGGDVPAWHQQLAEQMLWDLQNARRVAVSQQGVRLEGFGGRDFVSGRPTGREAAIEYFLRDSAAGRWLVRRESHAAARSSAGARTELVCNVEHLVWGTQIIDQPGSPPNSGNSTPLPVRVTVQLYAPASDVPFFDRVFHVF